MNLKICDVCYEESKKKDIIKSKYRISYKNRMNGIRIALDVCEQHKAFFKKCKTFDGAYKKYNDLLFGEKVLIKE